MVEFQAFGGESVSLFGFAGNGSVGEIDVTTFVRRTPVVVDEDGTTLLPKT